MKRLLVGLQIVAVGLMAVVAPPPARANVSHWGHHAGSASGTTSTGESFSITWFQAQQADWDYKDDPYTNDVMEFHVEVGSLSIDTDDPSTVIYNPVTDTYKLKLMHPSCTVDVTVEKPTRTWVDQAGVTWAVGRDTGGWIIADGKPPRINHGGTGNHSSWPDLVAAYWRNDTRTSNGQVCGRTFNNQFGSSRIQTKSTVR